MNETTTKLGVIQNIGLFDRVLRLTIGAALLGGVFVHLGVHHALVSWHGYVTMLSVYPLITAWLGWDPIYQVFETKTCDLSSRNRCGTVPYQVDAALGHNPIPNKDYDHSLSGSHH